MGIKQALKRGRRLDEQIMTDTCVITRGTKEYVTNPDTGDVEEISATVFEGKCWMTSAPDTGRVVHSGEYSYATESPRLHLPYDVEVRANDEAVITATETDNPTLGWRMRLIDLNRGTYRTSQRWNVEVFTR